jgi:hypothetical protein
MKKLLIIFLAAMSSIPSTAEDVEKEWQAKVDQLIAERIKSYELLPDALKMIQASESTTVFEGMPHQSQEKKLLEKELAKTEETLIGGFPFYPEPRELLKTDRPALDKFLDKGKGFGEYSGPSWCGDFHPDYAIRFKSGDQTFDLLLCFGCGEARIHMGDKIIYCDINRNDWKKLLSVYAKLRPKSE